MSLCRSLLIANQDKTIYNALKRDMVLWYDLKKQGATNESMNKDPRLIDLSGNENHATCNNFAWKGDSGIGMYPIIFTYNDDCFTSNERGNILTSNGSKIDYHDTSLWAIKYSTATKNTEEFSIKIDGTFGENSVIIYWYLQENSIQNHIVFNSPGTYKLPKSYNLNYDEIITGSGAVSNAISITGSFTGTIEILPNYENYLVSDGVDDYAQVNYTPLLDINKGFTIICNRYKLDGLSYSTALITERVDIAVNKAFSFELDYSSSNLRCDSFGNINDNLKYNESNISWMTSNSYNGQNIIKGDASASGQINILTLNPKGDSAIKAAIKTFILFNRDLTEQEIQWVINNLI